MTSSEFYESHVLDNAKCGHLNHYRKIGEHRALCGFQPSQVVRAAARQMRPCHGWRGKRGGFPLCHSCSERFSFLYRKLLLEESGDPRLVKRVVERRGQGGLLTPEQARIAGQIGKGRSE